MLPWSGRLRSSLFVVLLLTAAPAAAAEILVCKSGCLHKTIGAALKAATSGDTVSVGPGTWPELIDFAGKDIVLRSQQGAEKTIIDARFLGTAVSLHSGEGPAAVLDGFTITRGGESGILIAHNSSPTVRNCIVADNFKSGIQIWESESKIERVVVRDNYAPEDGGGIYVAGRATPTISDSHIYDNMAKGYGGGVGVNFAAPTMQRCTIDSNLSWRGGGVSAVGWTYSYYRIQIVESTITGNYAMDWGGGIHVSSDGVYPHLIDKSLIVGNYAGNTGGGMYLEKTSPQILSSIIADNYAEGSGGGIGVDCGGPTIQRSTIAGNGSQGREEGSRLRA